MIAPASKRPPEPPSTPERWGGPAAWSVLALVCAASILVLTILGTRLTFFNDDWYFLLQRPGLEGSSVLSPHNGQLVVGVDLSYKALVALWGFDQLPFRLLLSAAVSAVGVVVYLLVAERIGPLLGIVAATLIVFLGPAWEALLFYASIGPVAALAAGLAALLLLQRDTPRRNAAAMRPPRVLGRRCRGSASRSSPQRSSPSRSAGAPPNSGSPPRPRRSGPPGHWPGATIPQPRSRSPTSSTCRATSSTPPRSGSPR